MGINFDSTIVSNFAYVSQKFVQIEFICLAYWTDFSLNKGNQWEGETEVFCFFWLHALLTN